MAKLAELCRKVPVAVKQSQIWGMIGQTYDIERIARNEQKHEKRYTVHRDAVAVCSNRMEDVFAAGMTKRPSKRRCTSHVDKCGGDVFTGTKRFVGSYIHVACRVRIY